MRKLFLATFIISITACTKEINSDSLPVNANSVQSNAIAADTYLPLTTGTFWKYKINTETGSDASTLTVLNMQKKFNGKNYTAIKAVTNQKPDTVYYNQTQHNYYLYSNEGNDDASNMHVELLFLKDDVNAGSSWTASAGSANGVSLQCYGKIIEKNMTLTIGDTAYKNVIHSYVEIRKPVFFFYIVVDKQNFYVAKNVGIIKNASMQLLPETSSSTTSILDYKIK